MFTKDGEHLGNFLSAAKTELPSDLFYKEYGSVKQNSDGTI